MRIGTAGGWGGGGGIGLPPALKGLLIANAAVFVAEVLVSGLGGGDLILNLFGLTPVMVIERGWVWQPLTYMFLHAGLLHLVFNMFVLWMFGVEIEHLWGRDAFLKYYVVCGLGAAALSFVFAWDVTTVGASGAVLGVLLAFGLLFPDRHIYLWFLIPIRARYLVMGIAALELLYLIAGSQGGIANAAHLGGMAAGWAYLSWGRVRGGGGAPLERLAARWRRRRFRLVQGGPRRAPDWTEAEIDRILDKISQHGLASLTPQEEEILDEASRRPRPE